MCKSKMHKKDTRPTKHCTQYKRSRNTNPSESNIYNLRIGAFTLLNTSHKHEHDLPLVYNVFDSSSRLKINCILYQGDCQNLNNLSYLHQRQNIIIFERKT